MTFRLAQPQAFSYLGGRTTNEDFIYPPEGEAHPDTRLFVVCDGVGGAQRGEVASALAARSVVAYLNRNPADSLREADFVAAIGYADAQFDAYFAQTPAARGMATTLCLLALHAGGATVAHVGDSRVYHLRDGRVRWQTRDHSLLNQLLDAGVLTDEEADGFDRKNVITRAIQGRSVQETRPDVTLIDDLRAGDSFLLCTDGVLENRTQADLEAYFQRASGPLDLRNQLLEACLDNHDNCSAYLVCVEAIDNPPQ